MKRQYWAICLLVVFVIGIIGVYSGFTRGDNKLATYGLFMALPAALGSFLLRRDLNREIEAEKEKKAQEARQAMKAANDDEKGE